MLITSVAGGDLIFRIEFIHDCFDPGEGDMAPPRWLGLQDPITGLSSR
jgi:hypothetical protein